MLDRRDPHPEFSTLAELLCWRAEQNPDFVGYTFLQDGEVEAHRITYGELDRTARAVAVQFLQDGGGADPALLAYPPGLDFIAAFFGCLYAGVPAIPAYAPRSKGDFARFLAVLSDSKATAVLTTTAVLQKLERQFSAFPSLKDLRWTTTDSISDLVPDQWSFPGPGKEHLAYLQYTSGSTASPKGVMVTHGNVLSNLVEIDCEFQHDADSRSVSWLPVFHDMGLVYGVLQPLFNGFPAVLMSPHSFVEKPFRWLDAISKYRATHSGGPNFGYDLCTRTITPEQRKSLDLKNWTVAFNGAEKVREGTLERFAEAFGGCGFHRDSFYPAYGLAEATLKVSSRTREESLAVRSFDADSLSRNEVKTAEGARTRTLVGCGRASGPTRILIVNPDLCIQCKPGEAGEIWVSGPGVAQGYWERPQETNSTFRAQLADLPGEVFLRTGDIGFLHNGELFISGRLKDTIIIRGRNYYPEDIESTVSQSHVALSKGKGAAFSVELENQESLVIVHEIDRSYRSRDFSDIYDSIRGEITGQHELRVDNIVLVKPASVPRTSSGKVQRSVCKAQFLQGSLESVSSSFLGNNRDAAAATDVHLKPELRAVANKPGVPLQNYLREHIGRILDVEPSNMSLDSPLTSFGMDSLLAAQLSKWLEQTFGASIAPADLLRESSIRSLSEVANGFPRGPVAVEPRPAAVRRNDMGRHGLAIVDDKTVEQCYPLSIEQERLCFLCQLRPGDAAYHVPAVFRLVGELDVRILERSIAEILDRHEVLRTNITVQDGILVQKVSSTAFVPLMLVDLDEIVDQERETLCRVLARDVAGYPFRLTQHPLIRITLLRLDKHNHVLVLVFHHIVGDAKSLDLFMAELAALYTSLSGGKPSTLRPLPIQYIDFALEQRKRLADHPPTQQLAYWKEQLASIAEPPDIWFNRTPDVFSASSDLPRSSFDIAIELKQLLLESAKGERTTLSMALVAILGMALQVWTNRDDIVIGCPVMGREYPETESLIGFFAYPIVLRLDMSRNPAFREVLARVRETALSAYVNQVPFSKIAEISRVRRGGKRNPLFSTMFTFIQPEADGICLPKLTITRADIDVRTVDVDLSLTIVQTAGQLRGTLNCNHPAAVEAVESFAQLFQQTLAKCARNPELRPSDIVPIQETVQPDATTTLEPVRRKLVVAATFTANLVEKYLAFWMRKLDLPFDIVFAPYSQVFQQLLDPSSLLSKNEGGVNVILVRLEDLGGLGERGGNGISKSVSANQLKLHVKELVSSLRAARERSASSYIVCLCPSSPGLLADEKVRKRIRHFERRVACELKTVGGVRTVISADLAKMYSVADYYDPYQDREAHSPYTPLFLSSLGTMIARAVFNFVGKPYKVIVLDCDGTLWRGRCGDNGVSLRVTRAQKRLQRLVVERQAQGFLLCLCSKNNEEDVVRVFESGLDLPLNRDHFAAWRINWKAKSENLRELSRELQVDLDSFVFVDDDEMECAEVRANCPEVLTLHLPSDYKGVCRVLRNVWAFDDRGTTQEDKQRSLFYSAQKKRETHSRSAHSLAEFIQSLDLKVQFEELTPTMLVRASQLTMRTNQMNLTTRRRTEAEMWRLWRAGECGLLSVKVSDRFGDYGFVGLLVYYALRDVLSVDSFILSCRALGRGVEYRMLAKLGEIAVAQRLNHVQLPYVPNSRNAPALEFLSRVGEQFRSPAERGCCFMFPTRYAAALTYTP